jgi:hypothetical protein
MRVPVSGAAGFRGAWSMVTVCYFAMGLAIGYLIASFIESMLHEYVSDAPAAWVRKWRRYPRLFRVPLNTYFSHHIIHHYQTFRRNHITQFDSAEQRARLDRVLLARGRHGRMIRGGDYAVRLHAEGGFVFALPGLSSAVVLSFFLPASAAIGSGLALMLPPLLSYWVHPYLHRSFDDGQKNAPAFMAFLLRTRYMKAVYRNHFMHHRYGGTSNYNLVLGADILRNRVRPPSRDDIRGMMEVGMPLD